MMNLHGLNCYCWDFIINIYIFFIILETGTPMRRPPVPHEFPQNLGVLPHVPLVRLPAPTHPRPGDLVEH
jgi:hypothetical protein